METKPLLYGLIGFFIGGLLVSVVATVSRGSQDSSHSMTTMSEMTDALKGKRGDVYDKAFIEGMIAHHEGAITMAKLSNENAKHAEIKELSENITRSQQTEIDEMKRLAKQWGYESEPNSMHMNHQ